MLQKSVPILRRRLTIIFSLKCTNFFRMLIYLSIYLSVSLSKESTNCATSQIWCRRVLRKIVQPFQFWLKSDNNRHFTWKLRFVFACRSDCVGNPSREVPVHWRRSKVWDSHVGNPQPGNFPAVHQGQIFANAEELLCCEHIFKLVKSNNGIQSTHYRMHNPKHSISCAEQLLSG
jgi:hypothetical protein